MIFTIYKFAVPIMSPTHMQLIGPSPFIQPALDSGPD